MATEATPTPTESRVGRPEVESASIAKITIGKPRITGKGHSIGTGKEFLRQMLDHQKELYRRTPKQPKYAHRTKQTLSVGSGTRSR